jgi:hypothetical protein
MELRDRLRKIAAVYFMAGSMLGLIVGIMQDFRERRPTPILTCAGGHRWA